MTNPHKPSSALIGRGIAARVSSMLIAYRLNLNILRDDEKAGWRKQIALRPPVIRERRPAGQGTVSRNRIFQNLLCVENFTIGNPRSMSEAV